MIEKVNGDLLSLSEGILVHGCNTQGIMGAGFARSLRERYSDAYKAYRSTFSRIGLHLGQLVLIGGIPSTLLEPPLGEGLVEYRSPMLPERLIIANAMTQDRLAQKPGEVVVSYPAIEEAFVKVRHLAEVTGLDVHFPLIGCGLAGGDWNEVSRLIENCLGPKVRAKLWVL